MRSRHLSRLGLLPGLFACALTALAGCAPLPAANDADAVAAYREADDPLEPTNRDFYKINSGLDTVLLRPLAIGYRDVVPQPVRTGIHNVLTNLSTPVTLADDMSQGKPRRAGDTTMRFLINTTLGVAGVFDVAKDFGYPSHDTDFGMTLAVWGVPEGPFLFLPILGPSNPRDAVGFGVDSLMDPLTWLGQGTIVTILDWTKFGISAVDARERVLDVTDQINKTALDPYATFRSLYRQHRAAQIQQLRDDKRATVPVWWPDRSQP